MYTSKNFIEISSLISNVPGTVAPLGELSTQARTFAFTLGEYEDSAFPGYTVYNFDSNSSAANSGAGGPVKLDATIIHQAAALVDFCLHTTKTTSGQIFVDQLLTAIETFAATVNAGQIVLGPVQNYTSVNGNASLWMPTSITWNDAALSDSNNTHQVWIDLAAFEAEYGDYQIVVVPPLSPLDQFFTTGQNVANLIGAITFPQTIAAIQAARDAQGVPETVLHSDIYNYYNPLNTAQQVPVNWPVLIYGPAGNNTDAIKDALMTYILANSSHNQADWTTIFPDIFKRTEFIIVPFWQNYAIPASSLLNGIYCPVVQISTVATYIEQIVTAYPGSHVTANAAVLGHPYRSLMLAVIGGPDNHNGNFKLTDIYPDYIDVPTTSVDFNRMTAPTQAFAQTLANLIIYAETMTDFTTLPAGLMKVTRNGILYAGASINNIQYLVATRLSVYTALGLSIS